jgi:hypothetical protein
VSRVSPVSRMSPTVSPMAGTALEMAPLCPYAVRVLNGIWTSEGVRDAPIV